MTTRPTYKLRLALAIALFAMPTRVARPRCVSWVNRDDRHTGQDRLVAQECAKLEETPTVAPCPLRLSNRYSVADTAQVFESDGASGVFGFLDKVFADTVIYIGPESFLLSSEAFQMTPGRWRSNRLQDGAALGVPLTLRFDQRSVEGLPGGIRSDLHDPQVDTQNVVHERPVVLWYVARCQEEEHAAPIHEIAFTTLGKKHFGVRPAYAVGYALPPIQCPDGHLLPPGEVLQYPAIVDYGSTGPELMLAFLIRFVGVGHLTQAADDDLGRQGKALSRFVVEGAVQLESREGLRLPRIFRDRIASGVGHLHGFKQYRSLFLRRIEPYLSRQLHAFLKAAAPQMFQLTEEPVPPTLAPIIGA